MAALYLTPAEERLFRALPGSVIHGYSVLSEQVTFEDTAQRRFSRLDLMQLDGGGSLRKTFESLRADTDEKSIIAIASGIDCKSMSEHDLREVFFVLGPVGMSVLVSKSLTLAETPEDMDGVAALSAIRHELIASFPSR